MGKTFSIGNTPVTLKLKDEFQGGNYGPEGRRVVKMNFNQDSFYVEKGKFVRSAKKSYSAPAGAVIVGTGVDDLLITMTFAAATLEDLKVGMIVDIESTTSGKARILSISDDRKVIKLFMTDYITLNHSAAIVLALAPSAKYMNGEAFELDFMNVEDLSIVNTEGTPAANNLTIALQTKTEHSL